MGIFVLQPGLNRSEPLNRDKAPVLVGPAPDPFETVRATRSDVGRLSLAGLYAEARHFRASIDALLTGREGFHLRLCARSSVQPIPVGPVVTVEEPSRDGSNPRALQLAVVGEYFRVLTGHPKQLSDSNSPAPTVRFKWTSLMVELLRAGVTVDTIATSIREEAQKRDYCERTRSN